jgi:8-oxo-dGTP diphosphatase
MNNYVVGFMFSRELDKVLLIQKNRPEWQAGKWNGIGGKVEEPETTTEAMVREFKEETSIQTYEKDWTFKGVFIHSERNWAVDVFIAKGNVYEATTVTDERVEIVNLNELGNYPLVPNLKWLIPIVLGEQVDDFEININFPDF